MKFLKQNLEITIIFFIGLILRLYYAQLAPHLHEWDERYHALVSRNMLDIFFIPMLTKNPIVPYDLNAWAGNFIWLHKQPSIYYLKTPMTSLKEVGKSKLKCVYE